MLIIFPLSLLSLIQSLDSNNQSFNWTQSFNSTAELNDSSIRFVATTELPNTVESFCNTPHPTSNQFDALQDQDKLQAYRDYLKVCSTKSQTYSHHEAQMSFLINLYAILEDTRKGLPCAFSVRHHQIISSFVETPRNLTYRFRIVQRLL